MFIKQSQYQSSEIRLLSQYAMLNDVVVLKGHPHELGHYGAALAGGELVPVGTVEFIRAAIRSAGLKEPESISYPPASARFLRRNFEVTTLDHALSQREAVFIKPVHTKRFTGFVFDSFEEIMKDEDREELAAARLLDPETPVFMMEVVSWVSEVRFYVLKGEVIGQGRYDDGPDEAPVPSIEQAQAFVSEIIRDGDMPVAFSADMGVMRARGKEKVALVECNDAWALGYYKGTLKPEGYLEMLKSRWQEICSTSSR